jgi:hypothetical protein
MATCRDLNVGVKENAIELRATVGRGGTVDAAKGIRGRGCGGWLGAWSQRGPRVRRDSGGSGPVCGASGAAVKTGEGEPLTGGPPLHCREAGQI